MTKGEDSWSLAEVVHAIVILTHFHSLCSFVFSCGVNQELGEDGECPCNCSAGAVGLTNVSCSSNPKDIPIVDTRQGKQV